MSILRRIIAWTSSLKVAIILLLLIALASALGTAIPQGNSIESYLEIYGTHPWLGLIDGNTLINLQLDHVYSSNWFLGLLGWLGISLVICSWRRQWPILEAALRWVDYNEPKQFSKLSIAKTIPTTKPLKKLEQLSAHLAQQGWTIKSTPGRLAARKGAIGRVGPPIIHFGLVLLLLGSAFGALKGQQVEKFLAPGRSFELLNQNGVNQITMRLNEFAIDRDPAGRPEQFRSTLELIEPGQKKGEIKQASVNHPLRFNGITVYQADWSLTALTLQLGKSPKLQVPLKSFPELGEQIWGMVIPTKPNGADPVLFTVANEEGPIQVFDESGQLLASLRPGGAAKEIKGLPIRIFDVLPASGLLLKRDPAVPIVYASFAITLIGGALSVLSTQQLWAIADPENEFMHLGGLSNRNLAGLANEIPSLVKIISSN